MEDLDNYNEGCEPKDLMSSGEQIMDYEIKITENGLIPDTYICYMSVINSNKPEIIYESKQFFLRVIE